MKEIGICTNFMGKESFITKIQLNCIHHLIIETLIVLRIIGYRLKVVVGLYRHIWSRLKKWDRKATSIKRRVFWRIICSRLNWWRRIIYYEQRLENWRPLEKKYTHKNNIKTNKLLIFSFLQTLKTLKKQFELKFYKTL